MKAISEYSAGGVVYRKFRIQNSPASPPDLVSTWSRTGRLGRGRAEFRIKWLICKHSGYHKWVLPKGIVEEAERPEEAAVREVLEETGVKAEVVKKISPDVRYKYVKQGILVDKKVEFYLMKYVAGDIKDHCWEMEDAKWVTAEEGLRLLGFPTEQKILRQAAKLLE